MSKAIAATCVALVLPLQVHAQVSKLEEENCLHLGSYAEHIVEGKELGISEKVMITANQAHKGSSADTKATMNSIVSFVFTMNESGPVMRKIVYLKCKAGEYASAPARKRQR